jgi:hypothetical protein
MNLPVRTAAAHVLAWFPSRVPPLPGVVRQLLRPFEQSVDALERHQQSQDYACDCENNQEEFHAHKSIASGQVFPEVLGGQSGQSRGLTFSLSNAARLLRPYTPEQQTPGIYVLSGTTRTARWTRGSAVPELSLRWQGCLSLARYGFILPMPASCRSL